MNKSFVVAAMVVFGHAPLGAFGQEPGPNPWGGEVRLDPIGFPAHPTAGGYTPRMVSTVYDNYTNVFANGSSTHLGMTSMILEDISFVPGPWATRTGRLITEVSFGVQIETTIGGSEDILLVFWGESDFDLQGFSGPGTNMINPGAAPLAVARFDPSGLLQFYWRLTSDLSGLPGGGVLVPDGDTRIGLQVAWVTDGFVPPVGYHDLSAGVFEGCASTTDRSTVWGSNSGASLGGNPATVGSTTPGYGRDISNAVTCPHIGRMIGNGGAPVGSGNIEHRFINASPARGYMVRLRGLVSCGSADFNCDGSVGDDGDIEAFFACLGGGCPPIPCASTVDFDEDGDTGTDADIEAFFRVLAGGTC